MSKILIAGDTHGDIANLQHKVEFAKKVGDIVRIIVLGDFGLWWRYEGIKFLDDCNDLARENNMQIFAVPGNHENHELWDHYVNGAIESHATTSGWAYVRTNVLLSPKVHDFVWNNKQFVVAGGAVSVDRDWREEYRRRKGKRIWSPTEQLTDEQVDGLLATRFGAGVKVDYLLTHDCSNRTPFLARLKPDIDSQIHRQRIDRVIDGIKPNMHFHGHMHEKYEWGNLVHQDGEMQWVDTYGLECNSDSWSWGVLDLDADKFTWGPKTLG